MIEIPYYAVIFTSLKRQDANGYDEMAERMQQLSERQSGFLGIHSARDENGLGITVSYWKTLEDISNWKAQSEHLLAQNNGKTIWYDGYEVRISKVERQYSFGDLQVKVLK